MSYIKFENVVKKFGDNMVLKGIDLEIERGDFVTLLGPSGCGKSTLLRCLSGLEDVSGGRIFLDGKEITYTEPSKREIGMVFQQYRPLPEHERIRQHRLRPAHEEDAAGRDIREGKKAVEMVALEGRENAMPSELLGRTAAARRARALHRHRAEGPAPRRAALRDRREAAQVAAEGNPPHTARHGHHDNRYTYSQDEAMVMSDVIHLFNAGRIEQSGSPIIDIRIAASTFAASFIGNYNILSDRAFSELTGKAYSASNEVAVRPETVELSQDYAPVDGAYQFDGKIIDQTPRGNVLRYRILANGQEILSDTLFRSRALFANGDTVHITIMDRNCIRL